MSRKITTDQAMEIVKSMGFVIENGLKDINSTVELSETSKKITIPASMTKLQAAKELEHQYENEEQEECIVAKFDGWNYKDALVAINTVTEQVFGWLQSYESFMSKPTIIEIVTDVVNGKPVTQKGYYGKFKVTAWENAVITVDFAGHDIVVFGNVKKKYHAAVQEFFKAIREHLATKSIYRGKSVVVTDNGGMLDFDIIENIVNPNIVLNVEEQLVIDNFVINSLNEPGKRCHLFTGSYGNGKTETAMLVGKAATSQGMSFFYLKDAECFEAMLVAAKNYQPCVVFVEDIDEIASGEQRDSAMNKILNTLDGVQTKGNNLTVIFTTNHATRINTALRRPGRIDTVIEFRNPDKEASKKIMVAFFKDLPGYSNLLFDLILAKLPAVQGAVIAEICKRSVKLARKEGKITTDQVMAAIASMQYQIDLMNEKVNEAPDSAKFVGLFKKFVAQELATSNAQLVDQIS